MNDTAIYSSKSSASICEPKSFNSVILHTTMRVPAFIGMEKAMRRTVLGTAATLAILAVVSLVPNRAEAITVTTPANIQAVVNDANPVHDVALACNRVWRCGPYGCGWRRVCWRTGPSPYYYGGPYYYGRPYYGRRYWW